MMSLLPHASALAVFGQHNLKKVLQFNHVPVKIARLRAFALVDVIKGPELFPY